MQLSFSISTRLQYQHKSLLEIIDGLSDEQIRQTIYPGKWSIFENIAHLTAYQHHFITRIKAMLEISNPVFQRYTAETDPLFYEACSRSTREIMQDLLTTRKEMAAELMNFTGNDLAKTGNHPVYGNLSLFQWLNFFLLHEAHHLFAIFKMTTELRTSREEQKGTAPTN